VRERAQQIWSSALQVILSSLIPNGSLRYLRSNFHGAVQPSPEQGHSRGGRQSGPRRPPAAKETFDRLVGEGIARDEARRLIGCVVASEIFDILKHLKPYDEVRYVKALRKLPELPE
jgi:hypothetical protein